MALTENGTPRIPNSRIFLGNLASERTSRRELYEIFSKYGRITEEIVLRRSFGFIQYDNPESAQAAINTENCRIIGGMRVDINLADNREPRKGQDLHQEDVDRGEQYPRERNVNRRDSPIRRKDIVNRRRRSRSRSPDRRPTKKRLLSPNTELYARIIFLNNNLKNYARKVEDMLSKNNIGSESIYLDRMTLPDAVDRAFTQKIRYVFVLGKQHESAGTVGLRINYRTTSKTEAITDVNLLEAIDIINRDQKVNVPQVMNIPYNSNNNIDFYDNYLNMGSVLGTPQPIGQTAYINPAAFPSDLNFNTSLFSNAGLVTGLPTTVHSNNAIATTATHPSLLNNYTNTALDTSIGNNNNNNLMGTVSNTTANSQNALFPHYNSGPLLGSGPLNSTSLNLAPTTAQSQSPLDALLNMPTFGTTNTAADLSSLNNIDILSQVLNSMQNKPAHSNQPLSNPTGYNFLPPSNLNIAPNSNTSNNLTLPNNTNLTGPLQTQSTSNLSSYRTVDPMRKQIPLQKHQNLQTPQNPNTINNNGFNQNQPVTIETLQTIQNLINQISSNNTTPTNSVNSLNPLSQNLSQMPMQQTQSQQSSPQSKKLPPSTSQTSYNMYSPSQMAQPQPSLKQNLQTIQNAPYTPQQPTQQTNYTLMNNTNGPLPVSEQEAALQNNLIKLLQQTKTTNNISPSRYTSQAMPQQNLKLSNSTPPYTNTHNRTKF